MNAKSILPMEKHPWSHFPKENGGIHYLILGSFPPKRFTGKNPGLYKSDVNFFYGSVDNLFWDLFCEALHIDIKWRCEPEKLKNWLIQNHWGLCDIVCEASRAATKRESAADNDLRQIKPNTEVLQELFNKNPVEKIYFTSKWVEQKFRKLKLNTKAIPENQFTLISPSPSGLRQMDWAKKEYKRSAKNIIPEKTGNAEFRRTFYRHFLNL